MVKELYGVNGHKQAKVHTGINRYGTDGVSVGL